MPVYTYEIINEDGSDGECFDVIRKMSDSPLETHPDTGEKVKRIYTMPHIAGITNAVHTKNRLSDTNLEKQGFTTYRKNGKGHYERTTGSAGPEHISPD
ncbi:MAG: FmdB family transcriptional regulator [Candidatus Hydrogenedentota bacterium]